ncbi:gluconeogenesis factor YvcK family protein [Neoactinobaculum massilliense]|uniref:gluconeogenesis factor YvcK family protein n=1 Tax=Neoactinobaculum massilliense TaxID=2364794 RepID=UPI000F54230B|nr:uridine diphosphate-N-acetylglucosamine-binding protein YvcK [Neoactinobaculum massilliense]
MREQQTAAKREKGGSAAKHRVPTPAIPGVPPTAADPWTDAQVSSGPHLGVEPTFLGRGARGPRVVAFGGGHGLYATLSALRVLTRNIVAVVTVADDGGSSGRLRKEFDVIPPGDLRMALAALTEDGEWGLIWRDVLQHRFTSNGPLNGHSLGNLLIVALWEELGDTVASLDWVGRLLKVTGRVLPMAAIPLTVEADVDNNGVHTVVRGQVAVATAEGRVERVRIFPEDPPAVPETLEAIEHADWAVFGPGSWYTSVIPHLMVPEIQHALRTTRARKALVLNLCSDWETKGMDAAGHLRSFHQYAPDLGVDVVIADPAAVGDIDAVTTAAEQLGATLMLRQVSMRGEPARHDSIRLAAALRDAFEGAVGDVEEE